MANSVAHAVAAPAASLQHVRHRSRAVFRRVYEIITAARQRRADREIARFIEASGGLTDSVEREIERRYLFNHPSAMF